MQTTSTTTRLRSRAAPDELNRNSTTLPDGSSRQAGVPKITAPARPLPRTLGMETGQGPTLARTRQNQVIETVRPNEDPDATLSHLGAARPTLIQSATDYANAYLNAPKRKHWMAPRVKERLDVNELVLVDFGLARSQPRSANRFTPLQYDPASMQTTPLAQLFIANNYDSDQFDPDLRHNGVYRKSDLNKSSFVTETRVRYHANAAKRGKQVDPEVATTALSLERLDAAMKGIANDVRAGAANGFPQYHEQRLNAFFHENQDLYARASRDQTINHIDQAAQRSAGIADGSVRTQSDEPRFDRRDEDMLRSALDGSVNGTVKVYPLRIGQHDSINAQRFTDHTGRTVLHMPGEKNPLRAFDSLPEAQTWLLNSLQAGGKQRIREFALQHFSRNDVANRTEGPAPGVLEQVSTLHENQLLGMETALPLRGDPYRAQADIRQKKIIADDKFDAFIAGTTADHQYIEKQDLMPPVGAIAAGAEKAAATVTSSTDTNAAKTPQRTRPAHISQTSRSSFDSRTSSSGTIAAVSWPDAEVPAPEILIPHGAQQLLDLQSRYPTVPSAAATYARQYMKDVYDLDVDPDKTVLAEFSGRGRGRYVERDLSEARLTTLTQLFTDNFDNSINEARLAPDAGRFGLYRVENDKQVVRTGTTDDPQAGEHTAMPSLLDAQALYRDMTGRQVDPRVSGRPNKNHPNRFSEALTQQRAEFFSSHRDELATAMKTYALEQASSARNGALNEADYALVRDAFNKTPGKEITIKPLQVDNVESTNGLLISDQHGRTIAYLPGADTPFVARDNIGQITAWMSGKLKDASWKEEFFHTQFSMRNASRLRQVKSTIDSGFGAAFGYSAVEPGVVRGTERIIGDPFMNRANALRDNEREDLTLQVKTNAELDSGQHLYMASHIVPFPNTLAAILGRGRTQADGRDGIVDDVLTAPLEFAGAGKGAKKIAQSFRKAATTAIGQSADTARRFSGNWPTLRMPQRVNGKIGYPLSPVEAPGFPGQAQGAVLPSASPSGAARTRPPVSPETGPERPIGRGVDNNGFVHTAGDTGVPPALSTKKKKYQAPKPPEKIELQRMKSEATDGDFAGPRQDPPAIQAAESHPAGGALSASASETQPIIVAPTPARLEATKKTLAALNKQKLPELAWLKRQDWMTDELVEKNATLWPQKPTTVEQMLSLQAKKYADVIDAHTLELADVYERKVKNLASEQDVNAVIERLDKVEVQERDLIRSQWEKMNPSKPMTSLCLRGFATFKTQIPNVRSQVRKAKTELEAQLKDLTEVMENFLDQNMRNNELVAKQRTELQKRLDDSVAKAHQDLNSTLKVHGLVIVAGGAVIAAGKVAFDQIPKH